MAIDDQLCTRESVCTARRIREIVRGILAKKGDRLLARRRNSNRVEPFESLDEMRDAIEVLFQYSGHWIPWAVSSVQGGALQQEGISVDIL